MKKFFMSVALISAIAIAAGYSMIGSDKSDVSVNDLTSANVEALASSMCPNGCLINTGDGCFCNGWYEDYMEKVWPAI